MRTADDLEAEIRRRLSEYYEPADIETWLSAHHAMLDGQVARDLIAAGRGAEVLRVIDQLDAGVYI